jgi:nucleoid DNA-binding protein
MSEAFTRPTCMCLACGGEWFREASYFAFWPEESLGSSWDTWPNLTGQDSIIPMTVCVCLCGVPLNPEIGGLHGGRTPNRELSRFLESLAKAKKQLKENHDPGLVLGAAEEQLVKLDAFQATEKQLQQLQKHVGQRTRPGPGRFGELPQRQASQKTGVLNRDGLALQLQERGLSFRQARETLDAILAAIIESLHQGGPVIVPPLGMFVVTAQPKQRRRFRLGKMQTLYRRRSKVFFRPDETLRLRLANDRCWIPEEVNVPKQQRELQCLKCGSTDFMDGQFRKYHQMPSAIPGGDLYASDGAVMRALICVCGEPVPPGHLRRQATGNQASFQKSFLAARRYREEAEPKRMMETLAASFAGKQVQEELADRIGKMEAIVAELPKASGPAKKQK